MDQQTRTRFAQVLNEDPMLQAFSTYELQPIALLQDENERRHINASQVLVNFAFKQPHTINMLKGRFLQSTDTMKIVLSKRQASALFASYDCLDKIVLVNGQAFSVIGVFQENEPISWLSAMSSNTVYITSDSYLNNWLIYVHSGKEAQREISLLSTLERMGARNVSVHSLFRQKEALLYVLKAHALAIILLAIYIISRIAIIQAQKTFSFARTIQKGIKRTLVFVFILTLLHFMPFQAAYLPRALTITDISDKISDLIIMWNNQTFAPSVDSVYLQWLFRLAGVFIVLSWVCVLKIIRKVQSDHA